MNLLNTLMPNLTRRPVVQAAGATPVADLGPTRRPRYEVAEKTEAFGLTVELPGVTKDGLELTAEEGLFRVVGRPAWKRPENWTTLHRETEDLPFLLELTHDNAIDVDKIHAEFTDGILRVSLPKHEAIKPRRIAVA
jgi:HSP20 family protein